MSTGTSDIAGAMGNVKTLPIPSEQRQDVFVCPGVPDEAISRWKSQAGDSVFWGIDDCFPHALKEPSVFCGVALFCIKSECGVREGYLSGKTTEQLAPFYARAGNETNAFQWQPIERNFVRRDKNWFNERKTSGL